MAMNRPEYRDAKTPRAVTVYTVAQESRHVVFKNVPALSGKETIIQDLLNKCSVYGTVETWRQMEKQHRLQQSSEESFTLAPILITFATIDQARWVKRKMDDQVFYANLLQVSYAPEYDTVEDIRLKLEDRRNKVYTRLRHVSWDDIDDNGTESKKKSRRKRNKQHMWQRQDDSDEHKQQPPEGLAILIDGQEPQHSALAQGSKNDVLQGSTDGTTTTTLTATTKASIDGTSPHTLDHPLATASSSSSSASAAKRRRI